MAILLFLVVYLIIFLLALSLVGFCLQIGIKLITISPKFFTLVFGIAAIGLGVMVFYFVIKFIFKWNKVDRSHLIKVEEHDEPELFKMIHELVGEVDTSFPKNVYLSSDVNASVFYDSGFWSMFLPVRKNLMIGMGLVNATTKSELKAVLAHEFGHFSQRTMKVGSYVYNVNQIIYNLVNEDEAYHNALRKWSDWSWFFQFPAAIAGAFVSFIQWVLKGTYSVVNIAYMGLSREMEFHADEVAASITGYESLRSFLLRGPFASHCYDNVLMTYDRRVTNNMISSNVFQEHSYLMSFLASESNLKIENSFAVVSEYDHQKFNKSKLEIKDQWASHPETLDRITRLKASGFTKEQIDNQPATDYFKNGAKWEMMLTDVIFKNVVYEGEIKKLSLNEFIQEYHSDYKGGSFPKLFDCYYDNKNPISFHLEQTGISTKGNFAELVSKEMIDKVYTAIALQGDIDMLRQIAEGQTAVKTFDYNGIRYKTKDSADLIPVLQNELERINDEILKNDMAIYEFFLLRENETTTQGKLKELYTAFFALDKELDRLFELPNKLVSLLAFTQQSTPNETIAENFKLVVPVEKEFRAQLRTILNEEGFKKSITQEWRHTLLDYLSLNREYFNGSSYIDSNLNKLFDTINTHEQILSKKYFVTKKELLEYQEGLMRA